MKKRRGSKNQLVGESVGWASFSSKVINETPRSLGKHGEGGYQDGPGKERGA